MKFKTVRSLFRPALLAGLALGTFAMPSAVSSHGIMGHMHVTGWAIENLPPGELRDMLNDPEVMNAAIFGSAYTDSGYFPKGSVESQARAYGEHTHWEPFIQDFVTWIRVNDPPPWTSLESKKRFAFMLGCASHGLQDEIFDSIFLDQVDYHDSGNQDIADPATDGFLSIDGHLRFMPTEYYPKETVLELYQTLNMGISEETVRYGLDAMETLYVNPRSGYAVAAGFGRQHGAKLGWTRAHYFDADVPGSIRSEILPTMRYMIALWERVQGQNSADNPVLFQYPDDGRFLRSLDPADPASWVTIVTAAAAKADFVMPDWKLDDGTPIPFTKRGTHWGGTDQFARVMQLRPLEQLPAGRASTVTWNFNGPLINGEVSTASVALPVQTTCSEGSGACPIGCEARTGITAPEEVGTAMGRPASCVPAEEGSGSGAEGSATEGAEAKKGDSGGCQTSRPGSAWSALWFAVALLGLRSARSTRRHQDAAAKG